MKNLTQLILLVFWATITQAQNISLQNLHQLPIEKTVYFPSFAKSDDQIFITGPNHVGLSIYHLATNKETIISDKLGAGYQPKMDDYGNVIFQAINIQKGRKKIENYIYHCANKTTTRFEKNTVEPKIQVDGKSIKLYIANKQAMLKPLGDVYYIWASLSPDKTKMLFTAITKGTYVTDLQGNVLAKLGYLNAPVWAGNNWVVGMNDKDNHDQVIQSSIEAVEINQLKRIVLTDEQIIAMYPQVSDSFKKIVFHDIQGRIFVADLIIEE